MTSVLFLNHTITNCGVYQYGVRLYDVLKHELPIIYVEVNSLKSYQDAMKNYAHIDKIIYNYHPSTMPWLNKMTIIKRTLDIGIPHEISRSFFDIIGDIDPDVRETDKSFPIPRPLFHLSHQLSCTNERFEEFIDAYKNDKSVPIIGSFGFGFSNKGFDKIVKIVYENYDRAVIKFVIPQAHFDPNRTTNLQMAQKCIKANLNPNIELMFFHEFVSNDELLIFLRSTTVNMFLYDRMNGRGISSVIDYVLSARAPFAISDSYMFRNVYTDSVCVYKTKIQDCIKNSLNICEQKHNEYSIEKTCSLFKRKLYL